MTPAAVFRVLGNARAPRAEMESLRAVSISAKSSEGVGPMRLPEIGRIAISAVPKPAKT
jgi:hypothetical protein